jgi:Skp family chaperone for outer membrane proteins
MKTVRLLIAGIFVVTICATFSFAQTGVVPAAQPTATSVKIMFIDTSAFDAATGGITRYVAAQNSLDAEFKVVRDDINAQIAKYDALGKEIQALQNPPKGVPIAEQTLAAKAEEYQNLEVSIKRKQEDAKRKYEVREPQVLGPIMQEIGKSLQDFATQRGIQVILDTSKLYTNGLLLAYDPKADVTKEFITFFNARPPVTASTAKPQ